MESGSRGFWVTNHFANHFVRPLLRGPLGRWVGRNLALLRVAGRRTGRLYELPVQYRREGTTVWITPGMAERKTWWRNLQGNGADVTIRLAGHEHRGHGTAIEGPDGVQVRIDLVGDDERH